MIERPDPLGEGAPEPAIQRAGAEAGRADWWSALRARHRRAMEYAASAPAMARVGLVVLVGYVIGLYVAIAVCRALPVSLASLEEAKRLGIVLSVTILNGYSKTNEFVVYIASQIIVIMVVVGVWWGWCVWRSAGGVAFRPAVFEPRGDIRPASAAKRFGFPFSGREWMNPALMDWVLVPIGVVFVAFDIKRFASAWQGSSAFLFEEGTFLSAVDRLLRGGVLYRDDFAGYPPLMFYPVKWMMEVFGPNVIMLRWYVFFADVLGFLILYHVLRTCLRHRGWALAGVGFFLANYSLVYGTPGTIFRPSIHESVLRYSIGLVWLIFFLREKPLRRLDLFMTGLALGLTLSFSHEIGIVACVAFLTMAMTAPVWGGRLTQGVRDIPLVAAGGAIALVPWIIYFASHAALGDAFYWLFIFPYYLSMGFVNLPFPPLDALWWAVPRIAQWTPDIGALRVVIGYWIPVMISLGVVVLGIRWCMGSLNRDDRVLFALVLMGGMLFKTPLARTDIVHFQLPLVPAVIIGFVLLRRFSEVVVHGTIPYLSPTSAITMAAVIVSAVAIQPPRPVWDAFLRSNLLSVGDKIIEDDAGTRPLYGVPRAQGIRLPIAFADEFEKTTQYLMTHTTSDERIVAFPNEPAYYFFAERANATRYPTASSAATRADRLAMIEEWDQHRPRYLVYSLGTPRIDNFDDRQVFPELFAYIRRHYVPERRFGATLVMRRLDVGESPPGGE